MKKWRAGSKTRRCRKFSCKVSFVLCPLCCQVQVCTLYHCVRSYGCCLLKSFSWWLFVHHVVSYLITVSSVSYNIRNLQKSRILQQWERNTVMTRFSCCFQVPIHWMATVCVCIDKTQQPSGSLASLHTTTSSVETWSLWMTRYSHTHTVIDCIKETNTMDTKKAIRYYLRPLVEFGRCVFILKLNRMTKIIFYAF